MVLAALAAAISFAGIAYALHVQQRNVTVRHEQAQAHVEATIRANQFTACERGNILRAVLSTNERVLATFMRDALRTHLAQARIFRSQDDIAHAQASEAAADSYRRELAQLRSIDQVNCQIILK